MSDVTFLEKLEAVIRRRIEAAPESSYTAKLAAQGIQGHSVSGRQMLDLVIAGEFPLALQTFNNHSVISAKRGAPSDWIKMEPATVVLQVASVAKGAQHPNAAETLRPGNGQLRGHVAPRRNAHH